MQSEGGQNAVSRIAKAHKGKCQSVRRAGDRTKTQWNLESAVKQLRVEEWEAGDGSLQELVLKQRAQM